MLIQPCQGGAIEDFGHTGACSCSPSSTLSVLLKSLLVAYSCGPITEIAYWSFADGTAADLIGSHNGEGP